MEEQVAHADELGLARTCFVGRQRLQLEGLLFRRGLFVREACVGQDPLDRLFQLGFRLANPK